MNERCKCGEIKSKIFPNEKKCMFTYVACPNCDNERYQEIKTVNDFMGFVRGDKLKKLPIKQPRTYFGYLIDKLFFPIKDCKYKDIIHDIIKEKTKHSCGQFSVWYPMYLSTDELRTYIPLSKKKIEWFCSRNKHLKQGTYKNRLDEKKNKKRYWAIREFMKDAQWEFSDYEKTWREVGMP